MKRSKKYEEAITEIMLMLRPEVKLEQFRLHGAYQVGYTAQSSPTFPLVFGNSSLPKIKMHFRGLRKGRMFNRNLVFEALTPNDAIIFFRANKDGLILISPKADIVIKLFYFDKASDLLKNETQTLLYLAETDFSNHTSKIISHGVTANGGTWQATHFHSNENSLSSLELDQLDEIVLQPMLKYYKSYEWSCLSLENWLAKQEEKISAHPETATLTIFLKHIRSELEKHPDFQVLFSQIHLDLHVGNILRNKDSSIIIDFEGCYQGLMLIDAFDFYRRFMEKNALERFQFWRFVGGAALPPKPLSEFLKGLRDWSKENFNCHISPNSEKLFVMTYALARIMISYDLRGINRLTDKSGFEYKIIKSLNHVAKP